VSAPLDFVPHQTISMQILEDRGYVYDSSLLPIYWGPLLKKIKFHGLKIKRNDHYLGRCLYGFAPNYPYHPSYKSLRWHGHMKILEVPITAMPLCRIPFHTSFLFALAHFGHNTHLFDIGFALTKLFRIPYNFLFHTNELSDPITDTAIKHQFGLDLPIDKKLFLCNHVLSHITNTYQCTTTLDYANTFLKK